jgi:nucleoside-diphosphate-sugar epimerase
MNSIAALSALEALVAQGDKVLVTGADGFLGTHLVAEFRRRGVSVIAVSRKVGIDILVDNLPLKGVRHVFHLAGRTFVPDSWNDPSSFYLTNAHGTVRVLDQCRQNGCSVSFASTYVYGKPDYLPIDEHHPVRAWTPYTFSKIASEEACRFFSETFALPVKILRIFNIYGPGQNTRFLIPSIVEQVIDMSRTKVEVQDLSPKRDYVYVTDVVDAFLATMDRPGFVIFNVGSGKSHSVEQVIQLVCEAAATQKIFRAVGTRRPNEVDDVVANIASLQLATGWTPRTSLRDGIRQCVASMAPR